MLYTSLNLDKSLEFATFCITVVGPVGDDDVVEDVDAHQSAGFLDRVGELVVHAAGSQASRRVVVADGKDGGIGQHGLADDDAHVDAHLADAAVGNPDLLDEPVVLAGKVTSTV